jgi:hypothetical protein
MIVLTNMGGTIKAVISVIRIDYKWRRINRTLHVRLFVFPLLYRSNIIIGQISCIAVVVQYYTVNSTSGGQVYQIDMMDAQYVKFVEWKTQTEIDNEKTQYYNIGTLILYLHIFLWPCWSFPWGCCIVCCKKPYRGWT